VPRTRERYPDPALTWIATTTMFTRTAIVHPVNSLQLTEYPDLSGRSGATHSFAGTSRLYPARIEPPTALLQSKVLYIRPLRPLPT